MAIYTILLILLILILISVIDVFFLYGLVSTIVFVAFLPFYFIVRVLNKKFLYGWREKLGFFKAPDLGDKVIMYHGVSVGEVIALENVRTSITSKATMEVADDNAYIPLLSYTPVGEDGYLEKALKCNRLLWNPSLNNLKVGAPNNDIGNNSQFNYIFGNGLTTSSDYQFAIGKYNDNNSGNIFEIGYGTSSLRENVFYVTKTGNVVANGDITDGSGNTLSGKQDILQYDTIPTQYSTKVMTSGNIYQTLVDVGITPGVGIEIPEITSLQTQINTINTSLTSVTNRVTAIENSLYEITDDTTEEVYLLGINEGELYIKLKYEPTPPEPEPEDDDEEEPET